MTRCRLDLKTVDYDEIINEAAIFNVAASLISEDDGDEKPQYVAAVGVVRCHNKWLLGLAKDTNDDRELTWVAPGGGIKPGETPEKAAEREVREETGIRCHAVSGIMEDPRKPGVAFVACTTNSTDWGKLQPNHEFVTVGFFTTRELKGLRLYRNVLELIEKAKRRL